MQIVLWSADQPGGGAKGWKAGDVIEVVADSHVFTPLELAQPNWRIVQVSGLTQSEADALTASPLVDTVAARPRDWQLDLTALPNGKSVPVGALRAAMKKKA